MSVAVHKLTQNHLGFAINHEFSYAFTSTKMELPINEELVGQGKSSKATGFHLFWGNYKFFPSVSTD